MKPGWPQLSLGGQARHLRDLNRHWKQARRGEKCIGGMKSRGETGDREEYEWCSPGAEISWALRLMREGRECCERRLGRIAKDLVCYLKCLDLTIGQWGAFERFRQGKGVIKFDPMAALWKLDGIRGWTLGLGSFSGMHLIFWVWVPKGTVVVVTLQFSSMPLLPLVLLATRVLQENPNVFSTSKFFVLSNECAPYL